MKRHRAEAERGRESRRRPSAARRAAGARRGEGVAERAQPNGANGARRNLQVFDPPEMPTTAAPQVTVAATRLPSTRTSAPSLTHSVISRRRTPTRGLPLRSIVLCCTRRCEASYRFGLVWCAALESAISAEAGGPQGLWGTENKGVKEGLIATSS